MTTKKDNHTPLKDSIDFGSMHIPTLFRKLLIPTVLGMVFSAIFIITDGIFVGKGIVATRWRRSTSPLRCSSSTRAWR